MGEDLERLKRRVPLLEYLNRHHWKCHRVSITGPEFVGLCPLHEEAHASFYVNAQKNLFYCHGCGRGGDLIRFVELSQRLSFRQSVVYLAEELAPTMQLLAYAAAFYQLELHRHHEGMDYLAERGVHDAKLIEELNIGYARGGGNLRAYLQGFGYALERVLEAGLINPQGTDNFCRRVIFPCRQQDRIVNLYGRSIGRAFPHRLLPRSKGGLFAWESVRHFRDVILVEGLFDLAVLWQAGFRNTTSAIGTHLTPTQLDRLCESPTALCTSLLIKMKTTLVKLLQPIFFRLSIKRDSMHVWSAYPQVMTPTATSPLVLPLRTSPTSSRRRPRYEFSGSDEELRDSQCFALSSAGPRPRGRLGQRLS